MNIFQKIFRKESLVKRMPSRELLEQYIKKQSGEADYPVIFNKEKGVFERR